MLPSSLVPRSCQLIRFGPALLHTYSQNKPCSSAQAWSTSSTGSLVPQTLVPLDEILLFWEISVTLPLLSLTSTSEVTCCCMSMGVRVARYHPFTAKFLGRLQKSDTHELLKVIDGPNELLGCSSSATTSRPCNHVRTIHAFLRIMVSFASTAKAIRNRRRIQSYGLHAKIR